MQARGLGATGPWLGAEADKKITGPRRPSLHLQQISVP